MTTWSGKGSVWLCAAWLAACGGEASRAEPTSPASEFTPVTPGELLSITQKSCYGLTSEHDTRPVVTQFLVDTSRTMLRSAVVSGESDFAIVRRAMTAAFSPWPAMPNVGVSFFPNRPTGPVSFTTVPRSSCIDNSLDVPLALRPWSERESLSQAVRNALSLASAQPGYGAPFRDAYLQAFWDVGSVEGESIKVIVLLSDGQPTLDAGCFGADDASKPPPIDALLSGDRARR
ncbi:MAG: hypothetical protein QM756_26090 [Polyangiaceae bacterium]